MLHPQRKIPDSLKRCFFAFANLLLAGALQNLAAAPGDLDPHFGAGGKVITQLSLGLDVGRGIAVQANGKLVLAGIQDLNGANSDFALVRYNPNGSVDTTFDADGIVTTDFGGDDEAFAVAVQADGKIVVSGTASGNFAIARYNADGSLDTTFDGDGKVTMDFGGNEGAVALELQSNGKIIVVGSTNTAAFVMRLNTNGSLDTAFDTDGVVGVSGVEAYAIALQGDGKILVGGTNGLRLTMTRLNSDGTPDALFGTGGTATYSTVNRFDVAKAVAIEPDGKILATGLARVSMFGPLCAPLVRFSAAGSLEQAVVNCNENPGSADFRSMLLQPDGKIVIGGFSSLFFNFLLVRYNSNLTVDGSFNGTGIVRINFEPGMPARSEAFAVELQADGKILIAGFTQPSSTATTGRIAVARVLSGLRVARPTFDFDGDRKTDVSVFRPENSFWYFSRSTEGFGFIQFGISSDKIAPADYDGDGRTDVAVFRENPSDPTRADFYLLKSSNGTFEPSQFGATGDVPASGDWDGDERADLAVFRAGTTPNEQSYFFYRPSSQPATNFVAIAWGTSGDKPVASDFDGDGRIDAAVFRPSTGAWYVLQSSNSTPFSVQFGVAGDTAVPADYDGDGDADIAVFRPATGRWYTSLNPVTNYGAVHWGQSGDIPVPADYDGDGRADVAVFRGGTWYLLQTTNGFASIQFGVATDTPVPSAYVR